MSDLPPLIPDAEVTKPILIPVPVDAYRRRLYTEIARRTGYQSRSQWIRALCDKAVEAALKFQGHSGPLKKIITEELHDLSLKREAKKTARSRVHAALVAKANAMKKKRNEFRGVL